MISVTPLYAGLIGLLFVFLSARVVVVRREKQVSIGDGDQSELSKRIRVQGNCAEYAPLALILMGMAELQGAPHWVVHLLGLMLLGGRILHPIGLGATPQKMNARIVGMVLTFLMIIIAALANIGHALF
ncbi:MAPEG family protein [Actibacterium lipolyticum]|uniref:Inner membrane protein YecN n=1 Tax=Actibacterium lipolyticum TaxID=1524263 RepID=A0A238JVF6_9RHOB|nr:MAPEG family protein [Actibacterium lipolyticum]SMX33726.1 Inner membrane protein YecN [Actibacterium lipolyticum]